MRLNTKGQVTIPAELRHKHGLREGDEVDVVEDGDKLTIVRKSVGESRGQRLVRQLRGRAVPGPTTDELMELLRGE